ncbi:hypothetical protein D3C71_1309780 [compost metagenome]
MTIACGTRSARFGTSCTVSGASRSSLSPISEVETSKRMTSVCGSLACDRRLPSIFDDASDA